jgi:hypothetical protein
MSAVAVKKTNKRLDQLEHDIEMGIRSIGKCLMEIRDTKAYGEDHDTFEAYCKDRWGFSDRHARNLIDAEKVRAKIGTIVPVENLKESHLIELSKLPEKEQAQVAAKVIEQCEAENREPTAKDFRNAIKPEEKPKTGTIVPVEETEEPVYEDVEDEPTDSPAEEAIGNGKHLQTLQNLVNELLREMVLVPDVVGLELYHARFNRIKKEVESIKGHLVTVKPVAVCPRCDGAGCSQCGNHGWVSSATLKELGK